MTQYVPTLDLRRYHTDRQAFVADTRQAFSTLGFCSFTGHGISQSLMDEAYRVIRLLFDLPLEAKMRCFMPRLAGTRGYTPFKVETAKTSRHPDLKEFWHVGRELPPGHPYSAIMAPNVWPPEVPGFADHALALYAALEDFTHRVLQPMALAIDLPEDYFRAVTAGGNSVLRALHYPPVQAADAPCIRAEAHEDISFITALIGAQGPGLEIRTAAGQWQPVLPPPGAIVVNVGDMLQRLTNHVYRSTTHRVVNPTDETAKHSRYSIPFFMDPRPDFQIQTLPSCITQDNPDRYPHPIAADAYLRQRLSEIKLGG